MKDGSKDDDVLMDHKCNKVLKNSWIVDFACSFHIYLKKECFDTYKEYDGAMKTLCDVSHMPRLKRKKVCETENLTILRTSASCDLFHTPLAASSSCLVSIRLL